MKIKNVSLLKLDTRNVVRVELDNDSAKIVHIDLEGENMKNDFYVFYAKKGERYDAYRISKSVKWGRFLQSVKQYIKVNNIQLFEDKKELEEIHELIEIKRKTLELLNSNKGNTFTLKKEMEVMEEEINSLTCKVKEIKESQTIEQECINETNISLKSEDMKVVHRLYREDGRIVCELKDGYIFGIEECGIAFIDNISTLRYYLKHEVEKD